MKNRRAQGTAYEEKAAGWLETAGLKILEKNYRCRRGEIDLIATEGKYLVFIEVKYRSSVGSGHPAEAVHAGKQRRIAEAALCYCYEHKIPENRPCRFDVVSILGDEIMHIKNAFEYRL